MALHRSEGEVSAAAQQQWAAKMLEPLLKDLGSAIAWIVEQAEKHSAQVRADSVGTFVSDLTDLASKENALAHDIDAIGGTASAHVLPDKSNLQALNLKLNQIKSRFTVVQDDVRNLDPQWAQSYAETHFDIGNFAADGILYYCIETCPNETYTPAGKPKDLTKKEQADELSAALRKDVQTIRSFQQRLQVAARPEQPRQAGTH